MKIKKLFENRILAGLGILFIFSVIVSLVLAGDVIINAPAGEINATTINAPTGRTATYVVCASDSVNKAQCDYICDVVDDQVEIQAANSALSAVGGGLIVLSEGNFNCGTGNITLSDYVSLKGYGEATILNLSKADYRGLILGQYSILSDLKIVGAMGHGGIQLANYTSVRNLVLNGGTGLEMSRKGVYVNNFRATNIHDPNGWAVCIHLGTHAENVQAHNLYCSNSDRGVEIEDGANRITVSGVIVENTSDKSVEIGSHSGQARCENIVLEDITLINTTDPFKVAVYSGGGLLQVPHNIRMSRIIQSTRPDSYVLITCTQCSLTDSYFNCVNATNVECL